MRFRSFEIRNFKGIEHAHVDLRPSGANIATLIGLNESGKTTILEAISLFSSSNEEQALYGSLEVGDPTSFVPKHKKSNFTGEITVKAEIEFDEAEREEIARIVENATKSIVDPDSIPNPIYWTKGHRFEASDKKNIINHWTLEAMARTRKGQKYRPIDKSSDTWKALVTAVTARVPTVVYFPTFLFTQPERVVLNPGTPEEPLNRLYRRIIDNVARSLPNPLSIQKHIVDRVLTPDSLTKQALAFWGLAPDKQEQINATLSELSAHLSETVFESWAKIFCADFSGREIVLQPGIDNSTSPPKIYLQFTLKDGTSQYNIAERSLGFRWFFSFLLFTIYRVSVKSNAPTMFLLDEPASNLHSRAQLQLVSSFPRIATGSNQIIYSTHSHYMINPDWLDQAFIVSNGAVDYDDVNESSRTAKTRHTNVHVEKYRSFVGKHPGRTTYFQPVLDNLDVVPSRLDLLRPSVLVEGKGDYLALEYGRRILMGIEGSFSVVPTRGASGLDELVSLFLGWAVPFVICLDDDKAGRSARDRYIKDWGLSPDRVLTLADADTSLKGKAVEGLLEPSDIDLVRSHFATSQPPTKSQVHLFFSEMLARRQTIELSKNFRSRVAAFQTRIEEALKHI
jgi:AAA15 family ATPase/GTPase